MQYVSLCVEIDVCTRHTNDNAASRNTYTVHWLQLSHGVILASSALTNVHRKIRKKENEKAKGGVGKGRGNFRQHQLVPRPQAQHELLHKLVTKPGECPTACATPQLIRVGLEIGCTVPCNVQLFVHPICWQTSTRLPGMATWHQRQLQQ